MIKNYRPYLVYIAGPYSAPTKEQIEVNIRAAENCAKELVRQTAAVFPVIPHCNTAHWDLHDYQYYATGTLELMSCCDFVLVVPGSNYTESKGTMNEIRTAASWNQPTFYTIPSLIEFLCQLTE